MASGVRADQHGGRGWATSWVPVKIGLSSWDLCVHVDSGMSQQSVGGWTAAQQIGDLVKLHVSVLLLCLFLHSGAG